MRFLKCHPLLSALILSVIAEGLCIAAIFLCSESSLPALFSKSFHGPAALFAAFLLPDVVDNYASKTQEFIFMFIIFGLAWLQWYVIFYIGPRLYRNYEHTAA